MENKYQNGKIYKITDVGYNKCYYGSTIQPLANRMGQHRKEYKDFQNRTRGRTTVYDIFEEYEIQNCKIELVELFPCTRKDELEAREGYYIKNNDCVNRCTVGRTRAQYYDDNKEGIRIHRKQYYEEHKDEILQHGKEYRENNKEAIQEQRRKVRETNKEQVSEKRKQDRIICSCCGICIRRNEKARHERSLKHQKALSKIEEVLP